MARSIIWSVMRQPKITTMPDRAQQQRISVNCNYQNGMWSDILLSCCWESYSFWSKDCTDEAAVYCCSAGTIFRMLIPGAVHFTFTVVTLWLICFCVIRLYQEYRITISRYSILWVVGEITSFANATNTVHCIYRI